MMQKKLSMNGLAIFAAALLKGGIIHAQAIQFPGRAPPVIAAPSVAGNDGSGRPSIIIDAKSGKQFVATYDSSGRLQSLKSNAGHNAFDIVGIGYLSDGRLGNVVFGNFYTLTFRYPAAGMEQVVDSFGDMIVRNQTTPGVYATQSVSDPKALLTPALSRLDHLFSYFSAVPGLSVNVTP
jgi:hypothetical protein